MKFLCLKKSTLCQHVAENDHFRDSGKNVEINRNDELIYIVRR